MLGEFLGYRVEDLGVATVGPMRLPVLRTASWNISKTAQMKGKKANAIDEFVTLNPCHGPILPSDYSVIDLRKLPKSRSVYAIT
jgi:hypothetical protein